MVKPLSYFIVVIVVIIIIGGVLLSVPLNNLQPDTNTTQNQSIQPSITLKPDDNLPHIVRTTGPVFVNASVYVSANTLPVYRGVLEKNGTIDLQLKQIMSGGHNITTEKDAPIVAKRIMEQYGGLPADAVYAGAQTVYDETINLTLHEVVARDPVFTQVFYRRSGFNGMPVIGETNRIHLVLGTDGELLWLTKVWRNYTYIGDVPVIPVELAIEKMEREELISSMFHPELGNFTVDSIGVGYYERPTGDSDTVLEPIWVMTGAGDAGSTRISFYIYARRFANFTASQTTAVPDEEIMFRDLSDTSPDRWFWDFGDGTNSPRKHPTHTYKAPGKYNVTLIVWNDVGSDTLVKPGYITIRKAGQTFVPAGIATNQSTVTGSS